MEIIQDVTLVYAGNQMKTAVWNKVGIIPPFQ